jgi:hypothetical protein
MAVRADVLVDGVRRFRTLYDFRDGLWGTLTRTGFSTDAPGFAPPACDHAERQTALVYVDVYNEHWPIEFCTTCLSVTRGRQPFPPLTDALDYTAEDVVVQKWRRTWPKDGKPRSKSVPPLSDWPETY